MENFTDDSSRLFTWTSFVFLLTMNLKYLLLLALVLSVALAAHDSKDKKPKKSKDLADPIGNYKLKVKGQALLNNEPFRDFEGSFARLVVPAKSQDEGDKDPPASSNVARSKLKVLQPKAVLYAGDFEVTPDQLLAGSSATKPKHIKMFIVNKPVRSRPFFNFPPVFLKTPMASKT